MVNGTNIIYKMYNFQINLQKYFYCIELYIILAAMKDKKGKQNLQILIHGMDAKVYDAVVKMAAQDKRSVGKQAEWMLYKFIEAATPEVLYIKPLKTETK